MRTEGKGNASLSREGIEAVKIGFSDKDHYVFECSILSA